MVGRRSKQVVSWIGIGGLSMVLACGGETDTDADESSGSTSVGNTPASSTPDPSSGSETTTVDPTDDSDSDIGSSSSTDSTDPTVTPTDPTGEDESSTDDTDGPATDEPDSLPTADGVCPEFSSAVLSFAPGETGPRRARVWFDPASGGGGPLVFYWHGTGSSPEEALYGLGDAAVEDILTRGGMVVAPVSDPAAGQFPWHLVGGEAEDDIHLMDEIVGCADAGPGIDPRHIHSIGMSAGGLQTSQVSIRRASYVASVVAYSGGIYPGIEVPSDDPDRPFPALIYHGGPNDIVVISFSQSSSAYESYIDERGGYTLVCNHGGGHVIPESRNDSWNFLLDHPFDVNPEPYAAGLPPWVPSYCTE